ncbi:MAG: Bifunctional aspartokinase/homoserine dehydrogenase 1 [Saprospiraceae bacterium]|nr:Bifunctional aspartokinase/homoserine dehydrogenase 1 [Saprospiraceae bacterium]
MKVLKFGGTSVGTPETIRGLLHILKEYYQRGEHFAVVFSAFSKVTDTLIEMATKAGKGDEHYREVFEKVRDRHFEAIEHLIETAHRPPVENHLAANFDALGNVLQGIFLLHEVSPRSLDFVVSFGERNSAFIIAHVMNQAGIPTEFLDTREVVRTDAHFGSARVDFAETNLRIREHFAAHPKVQAATGFIGSTSDGLTTTLGRGGSDYTAAILGAALDAEAIEIWTDVDGVFTADPRRVKKAFTLPSITYHEAMEMSHFGAKVIYPPTILPALEKGIPLVIKNTFNPSFTGTYIGNAPLPARTKTSSSNQIGGGSSLSSPEVQGSVVTGISSINQICLLTLQGSGLFGVPGIAARLFGAMARAGVNVVIITQGSSESSITFAVSPAQAKPAQHAAEKEFAYEIREHLVEPLKIEDDLAVVAIVGENMRYQPGVAGRLFQALGKNGINVVVIAQGSSELNVSVVISAADETKALNAIHEAFFLSDTKTLHLFMVGTGLIGGTLLRQIHAQAAFLKEKRDLEIKIAGLANSRKMIFSEEGVSLNEWKNALDTGEPFTMPRFLEKMKTLNLPNAIFIDNTASEEVAGFYEQILDASISISTPNKVAASSSYLQYSRLKQIAAKRGALWRYETNVGAGLPIITTLNDLIHSGDRILKIEGILSGTLSFIFNNFQAGARFSEIVKEARRLGLTEPDPREDLSGADMRRKLLILARETGLPLEANDIRVENILPHACLSVRTVEEFMETLEKHDADFEQLRQNAEKEGKVLRFVAKLEETHASISLLPYDQNHPFYFLSGSDNMVVFTTERYRERPLVVRGPGAGAEVTAAGVFAEVIGMA